MSKSYPEFDFTITRRGLLVKVTHGDFVACDLLGTGRLTVLTNRIVEIGKTGEMDNEELLQQFYDELDQQIKGTGLAYDRD